MNPHHAAEPTFALNLRITARERDQLRDLQHRMQERSMAGTIRRALSLLETVVEVQEAGGRVITEDAQLRLTHLPGFARRRPQPAP